MAKRFSKKKQGSEYIEAMYTYPFAILFIFLMLFAILNYIATNSAKSNVAPYVRNAIQEPTWQEAKKELNKIASHSWDSSDSDRNQRKIEISSVQITDVNSDGDVYTINSLSSDFSNSSLWTIGNVLTVNFKVTNPTSGLMSMSKVFSVTIFDQGVSFIEAETNFSISFQIENDIY